MQTGYRENYALLKAFNLNGPFFKTVRANQVKRHMIAITEGG